MKVCSKKDCIIGGQPQPFSNFHKDKAKEDRLRTTCKSCVRKYCELYEKERKEYRETHKEQAKCAREIYKEKRNKRAKQRRVEDLNFKIDGNLRRRLYHAIKGKAKTGSAVRDMCCSVEQLFKMFETMYENNPEHPILGRMCRENYGWVNGILGWTVDHVVPLSFFDLTDRNEFLKAVHYTNLRPMWGEQNSKEQARGLSKKKKLK